MADAEISREAEQEYWSDICFGQRCCICDAIFPPPYTGEFAFCLAFVPEAAEVPHSIGIHIDHHVEAFSAHVVPVEEPPCVLWMVALSQEQVARLLQKGRTSQFTRRLALRSPGAMGSHQHDHASGR